MAKNKKEELKKSELNRVQGGLPLSKPKDPVGGLMPKVDEEGALILPPKGEQPKL